MLLVGVALLAVATILVRRGAPAEWAAWRPRSSAWVLGLTGIGLLASAIYFLLERIGGQDQD